MYSDLSTTHRLYANCVMAGINPDDLTEDWVSGDDLSCPAGGAAESGGGAAL